jgi:AraC-like DNA-binding protein/quercetin dioxygenase-like cupin family protein
MQELELDHFLRSHTELESAFLEPESFQNNISNADKASLLDSDNLKTIPATKGFFIELRRSPDKFDILDEDTYIPPGQNIAFFVHPRYAVFPSHRHSFIELIYVYSGQCNQIINDTPVTMQQGEMCILDTHTFHSIQKAGKDDIIINCLMRKSFFDAVLLGRLSGNDVFARFFIKIIYQSKNFDEYIVLHSAESRKIQQLMKMILCEYYDKTMCSDEVINSYMIILFAEMLQVYKRDLNTRNLPTLHNTKISDIILYIQKNYKDVTLKSVAKHFYFHPTHLSKILKKITGTRFIDILHQVRLNKAGILLKTTDLPVKMIANEVGYENISFFYRIFKKHFECTPSEYRKEIGHQAGYHN